MFLEDIPSNTLLLILLNICKELRDFYGFFKVPNAHLLSRFKLGFADYIELIFQHMAYCLMSSQVASCPDTKQQYITRHFCYADKFAILTNGLGIVRDIAFLDDD